MAQHATSQNQMQLVDEHGNRVHEMGGTGTQGTAMGFAPAATGTDAMNKEQEHHHEGQHGSSSSSSSEDDGEGGRRKKKGIKEKIKETLTGGTTDDKKELGDHQQTAQTTSTADHTEGGEKKGMMEKIKDKIPGMH